MGIVPGDRLALDGVWLILLGIVPGYLLFLADFTVDSIESFCWVTGLPWSASIGFSVDIVLGDLLVLVGVLRILGGHCARPARLGHFWMILLRGSVPRDLLDVEALCLILCGHCAGPVSLP